MKRLFILVFSIATVALGMRAANTLPEATAAHILPEATAAHFCQLMVCDNSGRIQSLRQYIHQQQTVHSDSLTAEQMFCIYLFDYDGWKSLRIFPHAKRQDSTDKHPTANRRENWYPAADRCVCPPQPVSTNSIQNNAATKNFMLFCLMKKNLVS